MQLWGDFWGARRRCRGRVSFLGVRECGVGFWRGGFGWCLGRGFGKVTRAGFLTIEKMRAGNRVEVESIDRFEMTLYRILSYNLW